MDQIQQMDWNLITHSRTNSEIMDKLGNFHLASCGYIFPGVLGIWSKRQLAIGRLYYCDLGYHFFFSSKYSWFYMERNGAIHCMACMVHGKWMDGMNCYYDTNIFLRWSNNMVFIVFLLWRLGRRICFQYIWMGIWWGVSVLYLYLIFYGMGGFW